MKVLLESIKAWPRVSALVLISLFAGPVWSQDTTYTDQRSTGQNETGAWYDQGWIWFVIIVVAIVLVLALTRKSGKNPGDRESNRFKDRR
ncbi:MAG: hypothetical protein RI924_927 [Bacteroidota bacterium]|jgi:cell division protein FtsW (lipid II flippase)